MNKLFLLVSILSLVVSSCGLSPILAITPKVPTRATVVLSTQTSVPRGKTIIVMNIADSGPGTLRQALEDAQAGYTVTFDPAVFPPDDPASINLLSNLPGIERDDLTIDASEAGVILNGNSIPSSPAYGLQIFSDRNTVQGLQIISFTEGGIAISGGHYNTIGGNRDIGEGPIGQGNMISGNNIAIGLWNSASFNSITGNLIGTDLDGTNAWGNAIGITISDGSSYNTIGPNNIIAFNNGNGIGIRDSSSIGNTITLNRIYANDGMGIELNDGGNIDLVAPYVIDFDLNDGIVGGSTCANCTVEIFSDTNGGGEFYEGRTTADGAGAFTFKKGAAFTGPNLTATATDEEGNSSSFSTPTSGTNGSMALQAGNYMSVIPLQPRNSQELEDNHLGDMKSLYPQAHPEHPNYESPNDFVDRINEHGLKWMRVTLGWFDWIEVEESGEYSKYYIDPSQDEAISGLVDHGISVLYTLVYWDEEIQAGKNYSRFQTEDEIQRYLDYVQFIVAHFKGRVEYYALLNEPNIEYGTQQYVESADYVNLVRRTVPVIRQADPGAKIIIGEVTPLILPNSIEYLFDILGSDVLPLVDGISWHSAGGASPEYMAEEYYNYPSLLQEMRDASITNGFTGEFWATEMHWRTSESPHPSEYDAYSGKTAAKYLARGIVLHLGMDFTAGIAENLENVHKEPVIDNLATLMAGVEPSELSVDIDSEVPLITNYNFVLSNGDRLVAIWSDGIAVEDDPGVNSTVIINGLSAEKVIGIDVLNGIEQELTFIIEDGNLIIRDLLIRDYPIMLKLIGPSMN